MYSSVSVYKQQCMMVLKICTDAYFMKAGDINSKVPYSGLFSKGIYFRIFRLAVSLQK